MRLLAENIENTERTTADPSENFRDSSIITEQGPENFEVPVAVIRGGQRPKPSRALQESQETEHILS